LPNFPFWLDLNCVAAQALERLGPEYDAARREVCGATAWLTTRLPGIEQLAFAGGMPFADADTQQWMQSLSGGAGPAGGSGGGQPDAVRTAFGKARAQAADNDLAGAAAGLQTAIEHSASAAEKLQLRIHLCELLLEERPGASLDAFARAILSEIDKYSLGSWNPALALQGLQAAYRVLARNDELKTESETLLAHIIALDAAAAVKLVT
jgi:type VI secretion system protein VasJ